MTADTRGGAATRRFAWGLSERVFEQKVSKQTVVGYSTVSLGPNRAHAIRPARRLAGTAERERPRANARLSRRAFHEERVVAESRALI
jgi:hypothetical protein